VAHEFGPLGGSEHVVFALEVAEADAEAGLDPDEVDLVHVETLQVLQDVLLVDSFALLVRHLHVQHFDDVLVLDFQHFVRNPRLLQRVPLVPLVFEGPHLFDFVYFGSGFLGSHFFVFVITVLCDGNCGVPVDFVCNLGVEFSVCGIHGVVEVFDGGVCAVHAHALIR